MYTSNYFSKESCPIFYSKESKNLSKNLFFDIRNVNAAIHDISSPDQQKLENIKKKKPRKINILAFDAV